MKKIYCIDLDDTICFPNHQYKDSIKKYLEAKPNKPIIDKINNLYKEDNKIIIFTARRMLTHKGNLDKIISDVGEITKEWLSSNDVNYHELRFGKPYADYYLDDKAVLLSSFLNE